MKKELIFKKIIAIFLSIIMLLSYIPIKTFAETTTSNKVFVSLYQNRFFDPGYTGSPHIDLSEGNTNVVESLYIILFQSGGVIPDSIQITQNSKTWNISKEDLEKYVQYLKNSDIKSTGYCSTFQYKDSPLYISKIKEIILYPKDNAGDLFKITYKLTESDIEHSYTLNFTKDTEAPYIINREKLTKKTIDGLTCYNYGDVVLDEGINIADNSTDFNAYEIQSDGKEHEIDFSSSAIYGIKAAQIPNINNYNWINVTKNVSINQCNYTKLYFIDDHNNKSDTIVLRNYEDNSWNKDLSFINFSNVPIMSKEETNALGLTKGYDYSSYYFDADKGIEYLPVGPNSKTEIFYGWYKADDIEYKNKITSVPATPGVYNDLDLVARYVTLDEYEKLKAEEEKANHIHTWTETKVDPTCEQDGFILKICKCGESTKEVLKALGHNYTEVKVEPTCTKDGYTIKKCTVCGAEKDKVILKASHTYVKGKTVAPTCTEKGYTEYICSACNNVKKDNFVDAKGHKYSRIGIAATYFNDGNIKEYCTVCGNVKEYKVDSKLILNNVTNIKTKVNQNKVTLSWNKVNDAYGYVIYRIDNNKLIKIKSTRNTNITFNQTERANKKYCVKAYVTNGKNYAYSPKYTSVTVKTSIIKPNRVNKVVVKKVKNTKYKVIWNKEKYATVYQVQYSTRKDFKNAKTIKVSNKYNYKILPKLSHKKTYYVRVRAVRTIKNNSNIGTWSSIKKVIVK